MKRRILTAVLAVLCLAASELRGQLPSEYWRSGPSQTRAISGRFDSWPEWNLGVDGHVRLTIHDALGREVARLVDGPIEAGRHVGYFDASGLPSGTYIARMQFEGQTQFRNMLLVK